ncbi:hypothetical protein ABFS83_05G106200 [Erythranthe nasuta]
MDPKLVKKVKPYLAIVFMQFGYAGFAIIAKTALDQGMSNYTLSIYRNAIATLVVAPFALLLEKKIRPKMTVSVLWKIALLAFLEPVIDQNLYYMGMKHTTATFSTAMCNILPAITFLLAWALRLEKVNVRRAHGYAKILGTFATLGGAMIMTLGQGSIIGLPWTKIEPNSESADDVVITTQDPVKGALMITVGCFCCSIFYILQAITMKSYAAPLSLTCLICMAGMLQGIVLTLAVERGNFSIWSIGWDTKLLAYTYSGVICSGVSYYVSGIVMNEKGPVFVTSFNPLNMVIVAVLSSFIFAEQLNIGKVIGATVIVFGLYLVIWGKTQDQRETAIIDQETNHSPNGV